MRVRLVPILFVALVVASCTSSNGDDRAGTTTSTPPPTATTTTDPFALPDAGAFAEQEVQVGAEPHLLEGTLRLPDEASPASPVPGVVIVHTSGPQDEDGTVLGQRPYRDLAEGLADRGMAVLTYEKRTRAYPDEYTPEAEYTVQEETVDDAVAALDLLRSTPGVDPARVYLAGHGLGAMLSPRIVESDGPVAGLVLLAAPARPLEDLVVEQYRYLAELDGTVSEEEAAQLGEAESQADAIRSDDLAAESTGLLGYSGAYWLDLRGFDPVEAAVGLDIPVLVLWGERDYQVTGDDFAAWQSAAEGEGWTATSYADLNHNFVAGEGPSSPDDYARVGTMDPAVIDDVAAFVDG